MSTGLRVAVVGSGPAGFYAAGALLDAELGVEVDMIERLPTPWGLVRLGVERAVVIGNGNVALDVARMLALTPDELAPTDTTDPAIEAIGNSPLREIVIVGRRGPAQASFTTPELHELGDLAGADVVVDPADLVLDPA